MNQPPKHEIDWQVAHSRNEVVSALGHALAHLEKAERLVTQLRDLDDREYTIGPQGSDAAHWIADAARSTRAGLTISRDIAGTA